VFKKTILIKQAIMGKNSEFGFCSQAKSFKLKTVKVFENITLKSGFGKAFK